jgi:hypothetical protein
MPRTFLKIHAIAWMDVKLSDDAGSQSGGAGRLRKLKAPDRASGAVRHFDRPFLRGRLEFPGDVPRDQIDGE